MPAHPRTSLLMILLWSVLALLAGLSLLWWQAAAQAPTTEAEHHAVATASHIQDVTVQQLAAAQTNATKNLILDVRQPWEYAQGHVPGAQLIPLGTLPEQLDSLPRDGTLFVICRSGNRSMSASRLLHEAGFEDVRNVAGGMLAWRAADLPVVR